MSLRWYRTNPNHEGNGGSSEKSLGLTPTGDVGGNRVGLAEGASASVQGYGELFLCPTVDMFIGFSTNDGAGAIANALTSAYFIKAGQKDATRLPNAGTLFFAWDAA